MSEAPATDFPVTTALGLPGMTIERDLGVAFGLVVRSMGLAKSVGAGFKALRALKKGGLEGLLSGDTLQAAAQVVTGPGLTGAGFTC